MYLDLFGYFISSIEMKEEKWCAWCGKYGDHSSGGCPEIKKLIEYHQLIIKFDRHKNKLSGMAGNINHN